MMPRRFRWTRKTYMHAQHLARALAHISDICSPPPIVQRYFELWDRHMQERKYQCDPLDTPLRERLARFRDDEIPF